MENSKFTIMGVGGAGCRVIGTLRGMSAAEHVRLAAADTDRSGLESAGLEPQNCLLAGEMWRGGRGCGGSVTDGKVAFGRARTEIANMISGSSMLLVVAGLGGGTASGGIPVVLSEALRLHIPSVVLVTLPFSHEGNLRRRQAVQTLDEDIHNVADAVIAMPNDLLFSVLPSTAPLAEAFKMADEQVARTVLALSELLCAGNLLNADFSSFSSLLKRRKSRCSLGVGISRTEDGSRRPEIAFEQMLSSPLLGGSSRLAEADAVIFSLLGGPELAIGDVQAVFSLAERYVRPETVLLTSASTAPEWKGMLQFSAVAIKFDRQEEIATSPQSASGSRRKAETGDLFGPAAVEQPVLPFDSVSKGIMESTQKVVWNGEDLDIPTYIRRNAVIDNGRPVRKK
ncbi:MAG: hypothetical protein IJU70_13875 [Lentisphaeria bacterium]|nr:hypothetical protein [Lentisphaeria bacterium]